MLSLTPGLGSVAWHLKRMPDAVSRMKALLLTLLRLAVMTARLCGPGGV